MKDDYKLTFIRGATTASGNSVREIEVAVVELIDELISRNNLVKKNILSITFTATRDLNACFPASVARKFNGLDSVAFLDCQQMHVSKDVDTKSVGIIKNLKILRFKVSFFVIFSIKGMKF